MRELIYDILLRLVRIIAALVVGVVVYVILVGPLGVAPSAELFLLAWLSGAAAVLLIEEPLL